MPTAPSPDPARGEWIAGAVVLAAALIIGLITVRDYGITVDEFLFDDYGPKALAWYLSGGADPSLFYHYDCWLYGPWFQMLVAAVQTLDVADRFEVRHALTFAVGLAGLAALLPLGRMVIGPWAGLAALLLCLLTGNLYGHLFFTPNDVPFMAAMNWALLAVVVMARRPAPSWPATIGAGILCGLALATRVGGILAQVYLVAAMLLCASEVLLQRGRAGTRLLVQIGGRTAAALLLGWIVAVALWPFLQAPNPLHRFLVAYDHFATLKLPMMILHWGREVSTAALPWHYIPGQLAARLPEGFVALLLIALIFGIAATIGMIGKFRRRLPDALLQLAQSRGILLLAAAALAPIAFIAATHATLYDGIRHVLFTLPALALLAAWALIQLVPIIRRFPILFAAIGLAQAGTAIFVMAMLHPLEYVATNSFAGWTPGSAGRFELDYWNVAATPALRRLEQRIARDRPGAVPSLLICIPWREHMVAPMFRRSFRIEQNPQAAEFIIETERYHCARDTDTELIDEVRRFAVPFAWTLQSRARAGR